ncbi:MULTISPECIES: group 1 glycosyl transferase [Acidobacteriaceae]|uniref:group 1 glycosyl transferase n=1 Tax=Acidobacteriaceae TaxID=204434 RepID=UPI0020B1567F|nr:MULTISPECIES: group 1 glycosyl transferase [Acidobacteriaceae]MDW5266815.1 group 1 glycosyl transferase [Edaphobacter sp.]
MNGACTIVSPNYLAYARTVSASYLVQHPDHRFFVLIVADLSLEDQKIFEGDGFTPVMLAEIGLEDLRGEGMKYDILELNTNVKPTFMKYLIEIFDLENLVYLDPDIFVYSPLTPVFDALSGGSIATLTPHLTTPVDDGKLPGEQEMLYNGTYNLGFIAVRRCEEAWRLLSWWERRCLDLGFSEGRTGLFVDQKWMNLAPGMFDKVEILRHPGCNMAYWNLHERTLSGHTGSYVVNGQTGLCFFHFSGIELEDPEVLSKNTNRFTLADRPDLTRLFGDYKLAVLANKDAAREVIPYGFDRLSDGTVVTRLARRIYAKHQMRWSGQNPFDAEGEFAAFAKRLGLVAGKTAPGKATWKEFNPKDRRVEIVHRILKMALRVLGPSRYELLMRYLAHIAVLRNQSVFLKD